LTCKGSVDSDSGTCRNYVVGRAESPATPAPFAETFRPPDALPRDARSRITSQDFARFTNPPTDRAAAACCGVSDAAGGVLAGRVINWSTGGGVGNAELTFTSDAGAATIRTHDGGSRRPLRVPRRR
jgi:hypothetical protein